MKQLNLPTYSFRITGKKGNEMILDPLRKKYVRLTEEEWVRQNFVKYMIHEGNYPPGLMGIEVMFEFNRLKRRVDILVHDRSGNPVMIVECKGFNVKLSDKVFEQIADYNLKYMVPYLVVTNGDLHYACKMDFENKKPEYLLTIPLYEDLLTSLT